MNHNILGLISSSSINFPLEYHPWEELLMSFSERSSDYGRKIIRLSLADYDIYTHTFTKARILKNGKYIETDLRPSCLHFLSSYLNYKVQDIYDNYICSTNALLNHIARDKYATYQLFSDLSPMSFAISEIVKDTSLIDRIPTSQVVVKPMCGSQGFGVESMTKKELLNFAFSQSFHSWNDCIVQEFVDSSSGIPGIISGIHDIRLIVFAKKIPYVIIRSPKEGDFRCNVSQSGLFHFLSFSDLPQQIQNVGIEIIERVCLAIGSNHKRFSVDMTLGVDGKVYLMEINSAVGMRHLLGNDMYVDLFFHHLLTLFSDS